MSTVRWYIMDVMPKTGRKRDGWTALLIDIEPDLHRSGLLPPGRQNRWLDLGQHPSRDEAWFAAEAMLATRH